MTSQQRMPRWRALGALAFIASIIAISMVVTRSQTVRAAAPSALINGDTVAGSPSLEEQQAVLAGFTVTVVTGATWDAMTQAQFAAYQVLIIGDPFCFTLASSATSNAATWAPVVMGTAGGNTQPGNRILIGTDPTFHQSQAGAPKLIKDGIAFAGAITGRTGVYFDMSCADNGQGLATLDLLSVGAGSWTLNSSPPCGGNVSLVAANPAFADITSSGLQGWSCSVHETFPQFRGDWSALAVATDTPSQPVCGTDPSTGGTACGEPYVLVAGSGIVVISPNISVSPTEATNPTGTDHTVTATVTDPTGAPVVGQAVTFTVSGQNNGATGTCSPASCMTDSTGKVTFSYHDANGAGDDTILASFVDANGTKQQASAIKHWVTEGGTPTNTSTATATASPTDTATPTSTAVATRSVVSTRTVVRTTTASSTETPEPTSTPHTHTSTPVSTATSTSTRAAATDTPEPTSTPHTHTSTPVSTATATSTPPRSTHTPEPTSTAHPDHCGKADVNGDGVVNLRDLVLVGRALGSTAGERRYKANLDVDANGRIDAFDVMMVLHCAIEMHKHHHDDDGHHGV